MIIAFLILYTAVALLLIFLNRWGGTKMDISAKILIASILVSVILVTFGLLMQSRHSWN